MINELFNQVSLQKTDQNVVASILVSYLPDNLRVFVRHVSRGIERADEGDGLWMGKAVEFFMQLRLPGFCRGRRYSWERYQPKPLTQPGSSRKHGNYRIICVRNARPAFQAQGNPHAPVFCVNKGLGQPQVTEIVRDPVDRPAGRDRINTCGQRSRR